MNAATTAALIVFFTIVQFYTSLAGLSPTPPVGYVFVSPPAAALLVGLLVAAAVALLIRLVRDRAAPDGASRALLVAWIGSTALAAAFGFSPADGFAMAGLMGLAAIFHVAVTVYFGRPGIGRALVVAYLAIGLAASLAGLVMLATRHPAALFALNNGRAAGLFVTANQFAAFLIAFVFVALGAGLAGDTRAIRRLATASVAAGAVALLATVSLAGLLGAVVAAIFYAAALGARRTAAAVAVLAVLGGALVAIRPAFRHNPADSFDRLRFWDAGLRVAELFPLTGVGPMAYFKVYPAVRPSDGDLPGTFGALHPHDAYLSLLGETGLVGAAAVAFGWFRFVKAFRLGVARLDPAGRRFAYGTAAALVAVLVQGIFDTIGVVEMAFVWIPFTGLALAAARGGLPGRAEPAS